MHQQYWWPLELAYTDAESGLQEYEEKMEVAGIEERIREEVQRQLDEYLDSLKEKIITVSWGHRENSSVLLFYR